MGVNFEALAAELLAKAGTLVPQWLPAGKLSGHEWVVGDLNGSQGTSLSINLNTGRWKDFATEQKGGDLTSLYAGIRGMTNLEAAKDLGAVDEFVGAAPTPRPRRKLLIEPPAEVAPEDAPLPPGHYLHGAATALYPYRNAAGGLLGYVGRYDLVDARKQFSPWRWLGGKWEPKALPKPRPLYGLDRLAKAPEVQWVMLVEGEKCCDALAVLLSSTHIVITWSGGAKASGTVDWAPLAGRNVDIWPDNDLAGRESAATLAPLLHGLSCPTVRIIVPDGQPDGWDAADAVAAGWDKAAITQWIVREKRKFLRTYSPPVEPVAPAFPSPVPPPVQTPTESAPRALKDGAGRRNRGQDDPRAWEGMGLQCQHSGVPHPNEANIYQVMLASERPYWFDTFRQAPMTAWEFIDGEWKECAPREVEEPDFTALAVWLQGSLNLHKFTISRVKPAVLLYANSRRRNCAEEWMDGLKWDGTARLDTLFNIGFGADDTEYHRAVSRNFLMGMCARVLDPGCQLDYMPILQGVQGNKKSSALRIIGGEWFDEAHGRIDDKDFFQNMRGKMLVELPELDQMERGAVSKLKGIITNRIDTYRVPYESKSRGFKRQCALVGATNRDDWNKDDTGARRFWPVRCAEIDTAWLQDNREQLFAEAVARYRAGENYWQVPDEAAKRLQDDARERELWHEAIVQYISTRSHVTPNEILADQMSMPLKDQTKTDSGRVCSVLRLEGWVKTTQWLNGKARSAWRRSRLEIGPEDAPKAEELDDRQDHWSSET